MFLGFGPEAFWWFDGLERDNSRDYFTRTRDLYEREVRGQLEALLLELGGGDTKVFRQHRDLRFSRDRRPLKYRTYGHAGRLFVMVSARGLYAGTGMYRPTPEQLEEHDELRWLPISQWHDVPWLDADVRIVDAPDGAHAVQWVVRRFADAGVRIAPPTAKRIVRRAGIEIGDLALEVEKLLVYCRDEEPTEDDVDLLVAEEHDVKPWNMTDAWGRRDPAAVIGYATADLERPDDVQRVL